MYQGICHGRVVREEDGVGIGVTSIRAGEQLVISFFSLVAGKKSLLYRAHWVISSANKGTPGPKLWFTQIGTSESAGGIVSSQVH